MHPVERFRRQLERVPLDSYPDCLDPIDRAELEAAAGGPIGVAAYPLSHGLYAEPGWNHGELPPFPEPGHGLMIVGNHPDSRRSAVERLRHKGAHGDPSPDASPMKYWRALYRLVDAASIERSSIFATNIHPAFFERTSGRVPRRGNHRWFEKARELLAEQVTTMRPRLLLTLGRPARDELARLTPAMPLLAPNEPQDIEIAGHTMAALYARHPSAPGTTAGDRDSRIAALRQAWRRAS